MARAGGSWFHALRERVRREVPTRELLIAHAWMRPIAHHLADHGLWHMRTESVARGMAIGMFWAFAVPFAQVLFAAAHCVWWRGNIPVAAAVTFITNPLTVGFWLYLAYHVGALLVGSAGGPALAVPAMSDGLLAFVQAIGWPTLLGMAIFAVGGAALSYGLVLAGARLWFHWRVLRRVRRQARNRRPD